MNKTFSEHDWLENFEMSSETFAYLCQQLKSVVERRNTVMRRAISVEEISYHFVETCH